MRHIINRRSTELIKWAALVLMTLDHYNKYVLHGSNAMIFNAGRLVFPMFAIILAFNLADSDNSTMARIGKRLFLFGAISTPAFILLGGLAFGWWPLNALFALLVTVWVIQLVSLDRPAAAFLVFVGGGALVEFWWPGVGLGVCAWLYARSRTWMALGGLLLCLFGLFWVNGNHWALLTPVALAAATWCSRKAPPVPRWKWAFYFYYPLHLYLLLVLIVLQNTMHI